MNCVVVKIGTLLEVHVTLSDRNLKALEASRDPIERLTRVNNMPVLVKIRSESDSTHYYSEDRDKNAIGEAGGLHRLGDHEDDYESVKIPKVREYEDGMIVENGDTVRINIIEEI